MSSVFLIYELHNLIIGEVAGIVLRPWPYPFVKQLQRSRDVVFSICHRKSSSACGG